MKLYRIKRISDGKWFHAGSNRINKKRTSGTGYSWTDAPEFSRAGGVFFKLEQTIKKHLHNLCCNWVDRLGENTWAYHTKISSGPHWERLSDYEVETITIIDHGEKTQPAVDFMGIKEDVLINN